MAKVLKCKDVVPGCKTILEGRDEVEVVVKEAEHVLVAHKMKRISGTLLAQLTAAVADESNSVIDRGVRGLAGAALYPRPPCQQTHLLPSQMPLPGTRPG